MNFDSDYIKVLFKQFCDAKGIIMPSQSIRKAFTDWIVENYKVFLKYQEYLCYLDESIQDRNIMEINKGEYDTLTRTWENAVPISIYGNPKRQFLLQPKGYRGVSPLILTEQNELIFPDTHIFLTHNPYNLADVQDWNKLHNQGEYNILIGMFGQKEDEDMDNKLNTLSHLKDTMTDDCSLDYATDNGNYFAVLKSNYKVKKLVKVLTR